MIRFFLIKGMRPKPRPTNGYATTNHFLAESGAKGLSHKSGSCSRGRNLIICPPSREMVASARSFFISAKAMPPRPAKNFTDSTLANCSLRFCNSARRF
ncbi:hypothetical protein BGP_3704 [Beggiatoa sp. PS]|nr:hypothetical protein BGP_3704 [Beggiatoa sp. PS]